MHDTHTICISFSTRFKYKAVNAWPVFKLILIKHVYTRTAKIASADRILYLKVYNIVTSENLVKIYNIYS